MFREDLASIPSYVPGKRLPDALKLSSNEVTQGPLPSVREAMVLAASAVNRYPDMGALDLREALAEQLQVGMDQVAVGCGSSALCQQLVQITAGPGDEVVFPWRSFEAYPIFTQVTGATPRPVPLTEDGFNDLDAMAEAITDRTRLIFVCNPNNPTGTVVPEQAFLDFMDRVPANVIVALDEAYTEYVRTEDTPLTTELISRYPNLVGLRTFSKAYGLAGLRVGYAFGQADVIDALNKVALPFGVNAVAQVAAVESLAQADALMERTDEVAQERVRVTAALGLEGISGESQANFVWVPADCEAIGGLEPFALAEALAAHSVLVRAFPEGVRITVTTSEESDQLIAAWQEVVGA
ncbi:histidinol-phosphate transaminase [Corynebacterium sp. 153RC1]|uniref:histidinol-phosphate transaminase n=1 Tax=unclassified Corynebacterium TaxID=2624378 RepID=UPI00211BDAC8|nr:MULTISPECIES: histidinol-phosphate transaminase [unclassified Corynebacterium]MCQ9353445.1 histidinol-phosphate transaminase [Corynebacterium sp. 209RC1]MCQ9355119.1 histidinol-phosphate transaminase [Corynebacterium sp. 1222RC1]MCQ9357481.1 histidinol-phosphate transaminase [Corynebacterium sp. 122RC1]MCQ9359860.1 histidinol-phosphate transaminase [Corynebacterium sp. 142RC1]MCQ9361652.1 histidinol-phosphate transaminase [Corynebacterium sp. 153RC1]